jgi:ATP-dependent Clp protease ATP-binding subunit ClpA
MRGDRALMCAAAVLVTALGQAAAQQPARGGPLTTLFERMDEQTRQVLFYARVAVSEHGGQAIGVEHILVGLLKAAPAGVQRFMGAAPHFEKLQQAAAALLPNGPIVAESVEIPFNREAVRLMRTLARNTADAAEIKPEHLLVSLLTDEQSTVGKLLIESGITREAVIADLKNSQF